MRIALVSDWYAPRRGGIEAHLSTLAARLADAGHAVHVITSCPGPASEHGIAIHRLRTRRLPFAEIAIDPSIAGQIADILLRERIDIVHAHVSIISPVALAGGLAADRLALPAVLTFHSFVPATPLWASIAGFVLGASRWRATMTGVSSRVCEEVSSFAPHHDFTVLPNAIDAAFWTPGTSAPPPAAPLTLVYAGRLNAKKHPERALQAAAFLHHRAPELSFRLMMCGSGPLERRLRTMADDEGITDLVEFVGWTSPESLREIYRRSHLFLSTATRESFGLAALEARSTGLPVVAMRRSAVADFVVDGESGALVDAPAEFARAVVELALDPGALTALRGQHRQGMLSFSWENALANHVALYQRAAQRDAA
jgi:glycosyltransferase involved in cell wall biosynthesis